MNCQDFEKIKNKKLSLEALGLYATLTSFAALSVDLEQLMCRANEKDKKGMPFYLLELFEKGLIRVSIQAKQNDTNSST